MLSDSGLRCEEHENPADFFLDTIIHHEKQLRQSSQETVLFSKAIIAGEEETEDGVIVCSESGEKMVRLVESYRKSEEYGELRERIDPVLQNVVEEKRKEPLGRQVARKMFTRELYATSFLWQVMPREKPLWPDQLRVKSNCDGRKRVCYYS